MTSFLAACDDRSVMRASIAQALRGKEWMVRPSLAQKLRPSLALVIAIAVTAVSPAPALAYPPAGPYEPNDSALQAWGPLSGSTDYNAAIENIVDEDWYVFYSPGVQQVVLTFSNNSSWFQNIEIIKPDGGSNTWEIGKTDPLTQYLAVEQGRYYVRVYDSGNNVANLGSYRLRLVPSDHFVNQACIEGLQSQADATQRVNDAQAAVNQAQATFNQAQAQVGQKQAAVNQRQAAIVQAHAAIVKAQAAVNKYSAAVRKAKAGMRREARSGKGARWRALKRKLNTAQSQLAGAQGQLRHSRASLSSAQSRLKTAQSALGTAQAARNAAQAGLSTAQGGLNAAQANLNNVNSSIAQNCQAV